MARNESEIYEDVINNFRSQALRLANIKNDNVFKSFFGMSPELTSLVWDMLTCPKIHPRLLPKHLLWTLMFLKQYSSEGVLSGLSKVTPKTFRKWVWIVVDGLCSRYENFILWENRMIGDNGSVCKVSVDGTDFRILEPTPFSRKWYSHKFRGPGLRYEVAVGIQSGHIVWTNGPFPAGTPDIVIFRHSLKNVLTDGERVEADKGYRGERTKIDLPQENTGGLREQVLCKSKVRARHETMNARLKEWAVLRTTFRHQVSKHRAVFRAIIVLSQIKIENGHPLFKVNYKTLTYKPTVVENAAGVEDSSDSEGEE